MVVVHAGVKQGLDHGEGEFGVLGISSSILGPAFGRVPMILGMGTPEQSTMQNSQNQITKE